MLPELGGAGGRGWTGQTGLAGVAPARVPLAGEDQSVLLCRLMATDQSGTTMQIVLVCGFISARQSHAPVPAHVVMLHACKSMRSALAWARKHGPFWRARDVVLFVSADGAAGWSL